MQAVRYMHAHRSPISCVAFWHSSLKSFGGHTLRALPHVLFNSFQSDLSQKQRLLEQYCCASGSPSDHAETQGIASWLSVLCRSEPENLLLGLSAATAIARSCLDDSNLLTLQLLAASRMELEADNQASITTYIWTLAPPHETKVWVNKFIVSIPSVNCHILQWPPWPVTTNNSRLVCGQSVHFSSSNCFYPPRVQKSVPEIAIRMHNTIQNRSAPAESRYLLDSLWICLPSRSYCAFF